MALAFTYLLVFVAFSFGMTHIMDEKTLALQNTTWLWLNITNEPSGKAYMDFKTKNLPFVRPLFFIIQIEMMKMIIKTLEVLYFLLEN